MSERRISGYQTALRGSLEVFNLAHPAGQWVPSGENQGHHLQVVASERLKSRTHSVDRTAVTFRHCFGRRQPNGVRCIDAGQSAAAAARNARRRRAPGSRPIAEAFTDSLSVRPIAVTFGSGTAIAIYQAARASLYSQHRVRIES
jgi:hypothetical protein